MTYRHDWGIFYFYLLFGPLPPCRHLECWSFKDTFHRLHDILEDDLKVWAVAVRRVFGLLTGTQHDRPIFTRGEAKRSDARSFCLVSSVTERLGETRHKGVRTQGVKSSAVHVTFYVFITDTTLVINILVNLVHKNPTFWNRMPLVRHICEAWTHLDDVTMDNTPFWLH